MAKEAKKSKEQEPIQSTNGILVSPIVTEKSHQLMSENKYAFEVAKVANKKQVAETVEKMYNVKVEKVNMINFHPKKRVYGRTVGWKSGMKKAVVKLKEGDKIEIFEGV